MFKALKVMSKDFYQKRNKTKQKQTKKLRNKPTAKNKQWKEELYSLALALTLRLTLNHSSTSLFEGPVHFVQHLGLTFYLEDACGSLIAMLQNNKKLMMHFM